MAEKVPALPNDGAAAAAVIRLLIVDDSVVARSVLERIITENPLFQVAKKARNAFEALEFLSREQVDIILLDIEMPGQSGLAALPAILQAGGKAKVIILSSNCNEGSAEAVKALAEGASDILSKPGRGSFCQNFGEELIIRLTRLGIGTAALAAAPAEPVRLRNQAQVARIACLGIGASTGGIHALAQFFEGYGKGFGIPVVLTQHLPPSFIPYFAKQLESMTPLSVSVAQEGERLLPNHVYVAPGEANLCIRREASSAVTIRLNNNRTPYGGLPAVDPMFSAMAECYGSEAVGVILTGMGRDGAIGAQHIVDRGGWMVAQDAASSVVWGMPGAVARAGLASAMLPPEKIAAFLSNRLAQAA